MSRFGFVILSSLALCYSSEVKVKNSVTVQMSEGQLVMHELLEACPELANATPSPLVSPKIVTTFVKIHGADYQITAARFEDTSGQLPTNKTFREYLTGKDLLNLKSKTVTPQGIPFESFTSPQAYQPEGSQDKVLYSIVLRNVDGIPH